jgi:hypothetical protein
MANHYVLDGGSGDGSAWDNAWDVLPATLVRGDTYYIGDGSYAAYTFDDATSGATEITVKKATAADHGTETGWSSAYGDGTAEFVRWVIRTDYWNFNGQYGSLDGTFGFRCKQTNSNSNCCAIHAGSDHLSFAMCEFKAYGYSCWDTTSVNYPGHEGEPIGSSQDCLQAGVSAGLEATTFGGSDSVTFSSCWFHYVNRTCLYLYNTSNYIFDNCWFTECINMDYYGTHGEAFSINQTPNTGLNIIRNCTFRNIEGSAWIGFMNSFGDRTNYNWDIYNNVFYVDPAHIDAPAWGPTPSESDFTGTNGIISVLNSSPTNTLTNCNVFGNTFCNMQQTSIVALDYSGADCVSCNVRNNLFIHPTLTGTFSVGDSATSVSSNNVSTNDTTYASDYASQVYTLSKATAAGYTLSSPYDLDKTGSARGADGTWDVGAYEFGTGVGSAALVKDGKRRYVRVKIRDDLGRETPWSAPSFFDMGIEIVGSSAWKGFLGAGSVNVTMRYNASGTPSWKSYKTGITNITGSTGVAARSKRRNQVSVQVGIGL